MPVTVVVPYYKGARYLHQLRSSLEDQGVREVVVVVDGGHEADLVDDYLASLRGIVVVSTPTPLGTAGARNFGARYATQPWITFLDQDDWWPKGFARELLARAGTNILAYDNELHTESGNGRTFSTGDTVFEKAGWEASYVDAVSSGRLIQGFPMVKLLIPREAFIRAGGFRSSIVAVEDFDLVWRLLAAGNRIDFVTRPRGNYLVRNESITGQIAAGRMKVAMRAQYSWLDIWTRMALARAFPWCVRLSAARCAGRALVKLSKLAVKRALRVTR